MAASGFPPWCFLPPACVSLACLITLPQDEGQQPDREWQRVHRDTTESVVFCYWEDSPFPLHRLQVDCWHIHASFDPSGEGSSIKISGWKKYTLVLNFDFCGLNAIELCFVPFHRWCIVLLSSERFSATSRHVIPHTCIIGELGVNKYAFQWCVFAQSILC